MRTNVSGFPRIGANRELKAGLEAYFEGKLDGEGLDAVGRRIRLEAWTLQRNSGIDRFASGDFSFYDGMLDTALLFGLVPREYRELGLDDLQTMLAMARGLQDDSGRDVKALPMRKWFTTNYHYIVPRFMRGLEPRLVGTKPIDEFLEARRLGFETRPAIVGPYSFLKLSSFEGGLSAEDISDSLAFAYAALIRGLGAAGAVCLQLDEPALASDLDERDRALLVRLYARALEARGGVAVHVNVPFGDIGSCYRELAYGLDVQSLGLDFVDGPGNLELIRRHGFPRDKALVAGIINGKNVWRAEPAAALALLKEISAASGAEADRLELGTSCSLLHIPLSLDGESLIPLETLSRLSFAKEKLGELVAIAAAFEGRGAATARWRPAPGPMPPRDGSVWARMAALGPADFVRRPSRAERAKSQQSRLRLPPLPTTSIGSFPQTKDLRALRAALKKGKLGRDEYDAAIRGRVADCVALQEGLGLDVLVHGEFERNDMVEFFGQSLDGFVFTERGWVQSYGARCVKPPIIVGDVRRRGPITVGLSAFTQTLSEKPVKGMLTGPVTILNWSFHREDIGKREIALQIALAVRDEALDLERAGIGIIQIDEAALMERMPLKAADRGPAYFDWAVPCFRLCHSGLRPETQVHTHMCYSDFADVLGWIDAMDADVISFEAARSGHELIVALSKTGFGSAIGPGVYDIHSPRVPRVEEIEASLRVILSGLGRGAAAYEGVWVNPDCGLKTRKPEEAVASLRNMVEAARRIRAEAAAGRPPRP